MASGTSTTITTTARQAAASNRKTGGPAPLVARGATTASDSADNPALVSIDRTEGVMSMGKGWIKFGATALVGAVANCLAGHFVGCVFRQMGLSCPRDAAS